MTVQEWESICDGCAKCCLVQLEDEDSKQLVFTDVACDLLDDNRCRCTDYTNRSQRVPTCLTMNVDNVQACAEFAPPTCSYRLLLENKPLPDWHHLVCGDPGRIHEQGKSVQNKVRFLGSVDKTDLEKYVVDWCSDE